MNAQLAGVRRAATRPADAPSVPRPALVALGVGPMLGLLVVAGPPALFPVMAHDLGVAIPVLGQVVSAMLVVSAAVGLLVGALADRHGYRRLLVLGALAAAACLVGFGLAPSLPVLVGAALVGGSAVAILPGLSLALAGSAFDGASRRTALGVATAGTAGSAVVGVPALTALGAAAGWRLAFVAAGLAALAVAWLVAACLPRDARGLGEASRRGRGLAAYRPLLDHPPTLRLLAASTLRAIAWFGMLTYLGVLLSTELGLDGDALSASYLLGGSGYILGSLNASRLFERVPTRAVLAGSHVAVAGLTALTVTAALGPLATVALQPLLGFLGAIGFVGIATLLAAESPVGVGATMAVNGALANLGAALGGAVGGALLASGGYPALGIGLPVFAVGAGLLAAWPGRSR